MTSTCTICDSTCTKACAQCHATRYCSTECQQTDWPSHRLLCSQYSTHTDRPDPCYKRAILFLPGELKPKFIWVECNSYGVPGYTYESPQVQQHLGGKLGSYDALPDYIRIRHNTLRDRNLSNTLEVICRDSFLIDGSSVNSSVVKATQGAMRHSWKGPILAMKKQGLSIDPPVYLDVDMQDYRDVVDYFISYGTSESVGHEDVGGWDRNHDWKGKMTRGVKINCEGDQKYCGTARFTAVDVPAGHPVFSNAIAPISKLVGMPIHTWQCPPDKTWKDKAVYTNVPATFLHLNTDESSGDGWGWAPMKWQNNVGSVLVVRSDGRDVSAQQVEALCHFCQFKMQPLFENATGGGLVHMSRAEVMGYLTPEGFRDYFAEMRVRKMEEGEGGGWETASVPG